MADKKISALTSATTPLAGTEVLPIVQSSTTVKVAVSDLTAGRTFDALGMTLTSTDAGAGAAPLIDLYRNSASPAVSDTLGELEFNGKDSAGNKQQYAVIHASILSPTSTTEQGQIHFETASAGVSTEKMIIGTTNLVVNEIGAVFNVRIEGDTDANLFYTDATNDRVGIGIVAPTEKLDVVGKIKVSDNIVIGTSGKGIDFSATAGTGTSELLADYEEGTWTPTLITSGTDFTSVTYAAVTGGKYIKVGNVVHIQGVLRTDAVTIGSASGVTRIAGLPYTVSSNIGSTANGNAGLSIGLCQAWLVSNPINLMAIAGTATIQPYTRAASTSETSDIPPTTGVATGASANSIRFAGTYVTS
jgi:hypothetical protein